MSDGLKIYDGSHPGELRVTFDRPPGNMFTTQMCHEFIGVLTDPPANTHVLRLSGANGVFCRGRDRPGERVADLRIEASALVALSQALVGSRLVTVAEVNGDAAGFGVGLAVLCDVAIASEAATFRFPEVTIDLAPSLVLAWLSKIIGRQQAFWLTATGEPISASRAEQLALINAAVAAGRLADTVDEAVVKLMQHRPEVHAAIKMNLNSLPELTSAQADAMALERLIVGSLARRRQ
jgi:methylglutaconyl-CoA hydratase